MDDIRIPLRFRDTDRDVPAGLTETLLEASILAPSGRNGQPWRWHASSTSLALHCEDPETLTDFQHLGAFAALGACLENFVLAAHHHGVEVSIRYLPDPSQPMWAAELHLHERAGETTEPHAYDELYSFITARCTNRRLGKRFTPSEEQLAELEAAVGSVAGAHVAFHTDHAALGDLAAIFGTAGSLQLFDQDFHRELVAELRWTKADTERTRDGIDVETLELGIADRLGLRLCKSWSAIEQLKRFGGSSVVAPLFAKPVRASGAVGLIWMDGSGAKDYLLGGRALERMWLRVTALGLTLYPVSTLPYFFARLIRGDGARMGPAMLEGVRRLRTCYTRYFDVNDHNGELMSFCLLRSPKPTKRSLRKPLAEVLKIGS